MLYGGERLRRPILHIKPYGRTKWISRGDPPAAARSSRSRQLSVSRLSREREQEKKALPSGPCPAAVARRATASSSPPGRLPQSGRGARDRTREGESAEARAVGAWRRAPELARQTRGYADGSRSRQPRRADWAASSFTSAGGTQSIGAWACTTRRVRVSARSGQVRTHSKSAQSVTQLCRIAERARAPHNDAWASPAQRGARRVLAASQL